MDVPSKLLSPEALFSPKCTKYRLAAIPRPLSCFKGAYTCNQKPLLVNNTNSVYCGICLQAYTMVLMFVCWVLLFMLDPCGLMQINDWLISVNLSLLTQGAMPLTPSSGGESLNCRLWNLATKTANIPPVIWRSITSTQRTIWRSLFTRPISSGSVNKLTNE